MGGKLKLHDFPENITAISAAYLYEPSLKCAKQYQNKNSQLNQLQYIITGGDLYGPQL